MRLELLELLVTLADRVVLGTVGERFDRDNELDQVVLFLELWMVFMGSQLRRVVESERQ